MPSSFCSRRISPRISTRSLASRLESGSSGSRTCGSHPNPAAAAEALLRPPDLAAHLDPQLGVEVGERLVEQQHVRLDHDRARDRDALQLAAGKLMRPALAIAVELHQLQGT